MSGPSLQLTRLLLLLRPLRTLPGAGPPQGAGGRRQHQRHLPLARAAGAAARVLESHRGAVRACAPSRAAGDGGCAGREGCSNAAVRRGARLQAAGAGQCVGRTSVAGQGAGQHHSRVPCRCVTLHWCASADCILPAPPTRPRPPCSARAAGAAQVDTGRQSQRAGCGSHGAVRLSRRALRPRYRLGGPGGRRLQQRRRQRRRRRRQQRQRRRRLPGSPDQSWVGVRGARRRGCAGAQEGGTGGCRAVTPASKAHLRAGSRGKCCAAVPPDSTTRPTCKATPRAPPPLCSVSPTCRCAASCPEGSSLCLSRSSTCRRCAGRQAGRAFTGGTAPDSGRRDHLAARAARSAPRSHVSPAHPTRPPTLRCPADACLGVLLHREPDVGVPAAQPLNLGAAQPLRKHLPPHALHVPPRRCVRVGPPCCWAPRLRREEQGRVGLWWAGEARHYLHVKS